MPIPAPLTLAATSFCDAQVGAAATTAAAAAVGLAYAFLGGGGKQPQLSEIGFEGRWANEARPDEVHIIRDGHIRWHNSVDNKSTWHEYTLDNEGKQLCTELDGKRLYAALAPPPKPSGRKGSVLKPSCGLRWQPGPGGDNPTWVRLAPLPSIKVWFILGKMGMRKQMWMVLHGDFLWFCNSGPPTDTELVHRIADAVVKIAGAEMEQVDGTLAVVIKGLDPSGPSFVRLEFETRKELDEWLPLLREAIGRPALHTELNSRMSSPGAHTPRSATPRDLTPRRLDPQAFVPQEPVTMQQAPTAAVLPGTNSSSPGFGRGPGSRAQPPVEEALRTLDALSSSLSNICDNHSPRAQAAPHMMLQEPVTAQAAPQMMPQEPLTAQSRWSPTAQTASSSAMQMDYMASLGGAPGARQRGISPRQQPVSPSAGSATLRDTSPRSFATGTSPTQGPRMAQLAQQLDVAEREISKLLQKRDSPFAQAPPSPTYAAAGFPAEPVTGASLPTEPVAAASFPAEAFPRPAARKSDATELLEKLDRNHDGVVSLTELRQGLRSGVMTHNRN